ncbi:PVC-type heme-binding CxxCH protein [Rubinisphaera sp.]|uniref:PVC-type heme-binding CxxCH protein n=1 Tax=Rubinisphaera sp. TaxID=2024857 RepID=UPI000C114969|nr:PVC-type heme-binding CxxCH protein [Rubinisphaera sp.]MBV08425.1 sorbosone dehydrogenase [Rubinisphaera sp.]
MHRKLLSFVLFQLLILSTTSLPAQRGLTEVPDPDPEKEQASFQVADGFEVNLFAAEPMIAKPTQMNWDTQGRLWVSTSETYPHVKPGEDANDKVMVLEDTDHDGVADKSTVFADGLLLPTAILPGDGGVYVANSTELLHLKDNDGDGKADETRIVLSGFGTEDTHHIIHTLKRVPDGDIYFNQSIYTHSHVETPYGVKRLLAGGTWKFDAKTLELDVYSRGLVNPWGLVFDPWGQTFETDGAGGQGLNYVFPDTVMFTAANAERTVTGLSPGQPKHCGLELLTGDHLPKGWSGLYVTNDFRGNRVNSFELSESGSGYIARQTDNLLTSNYVSFRPIDILMGPDGGIYVADWYNPIIQHGEVDFRDERRDHEHGRIWRIVPKDYKPESITLPAEAEIGTLVDQLCSDQKWYRDQARYELSTRKPEHVFLILDEEAVDTQEPWNEAQLKLSGLWLAEDWNLPEEIQKRLPKLLTYDNPQMEKSANVRAAAVRIAGAHPEFEDWMDWMKAAIEDPHAQVRLEAVHALRHAGTLEAIRLAATAVREDNDRFLEFSLWQTFRETEPVWLKSFLADPNSMSSNPNTLLTIANAARSAEVVDPVLKLWQDGKIPADKTSAVLNLVAERGNTAHLQQLWKISQQPDPPHSQAILNTLVNAAERRKIKPEVSEDDLLALIKSENAQVQILGCRLAGLWKVVASRSALKTLANTETQPRSLRKTALQSLAQLGGPDSRDYLLSIAKGEQLKALQVDGIEALASMNLNLAVQAAVETLSQTDSAAEVNAILNPLLSTKQGPNLLTRALQDAHWNADVATAAVRMASSLPQQNPALVSAIRKAGSLEAMKAELTPAEMQELVSEITSQGNVHRGEEIYRREKLLCMKCHAIGGAGGKVGPDLSSIGASAPVDYLVESLLVPSKKIKEGYHAVQVVTIDGIVLAGVPILENQDEIHIRDAEGKVNVVPVEDIELKKNSTVSLMPADLVGKLRRDELVDLVRFISALGKTGELVVSKQQYVRTWEVLNPGDNVKAINDAIRHNGIEHAATDDPLLPWTATYSQVDGSLALQPLAWMGNIAAKNLQFARFELNVIQAGRIGLKIDDPTGLRIWVDQTEVEVQPEIAVELSTGTHRVTVASESQARGMKPIRIELIEVEGSNGQAALVNY